MVGKLKVNSKRHGNVLGKDIRMVDTKEPVIADGAVICATDRMIEEKCFYSKQG